ncbi:MAG: hypothetical protein ABIP78_06210 [Pyrinomonadaceae bacterium]
MRRSSFPLNSLTVAVLCVCIALIATPPFVFGQKKTAPAEATPLPMRDEFKLGKVDLELLEQVDLLDRRCDREGLVLDDPATSAYLARIGGTLIEKELVLEGVTLKFRVLREYPTVEQSRIVRNPLRARVETQHSRLLSLIQRPRTRGPSIGHTLF